MTSPFKPLRGVRILDLTNVLSGPLACYQLAWLGAEIVKVEPVGIGDLARQLGEAPQQSRAHMGASFLAQNAGKKSLSLNLKRARGSQIFRQLVRTADVLIENFRPGVMDRLGLGYETLKQERADLIYCAISGFGQQGPWRERPAYDQIVQGAAGIMSVTGENADRPLRVGYPVADSIGGLTAAMAVAAALNAPVRGCYIDVSMMASVLSTMGWAVSNYMVAGVEPKPVGNENVTSSPSGAFCCRDGLINISANKDEQWAILARHLGLGHLLAHPDYLTRELRKRNRASLTQEVEAKLAARDAADWAAELSVLGVPAGEVLSLPQVLTHPQFEARKQAVAFDDVLEDGGSLRVLRPGYLVDGRPLEVDCPPPRLGADNAAILRELGIGPDEMEALARDGTI